MTAGDITALVVATTALISAVGGVIALFKHQTGPQHNPDPPPPH